MHNPIKVLDPELMLFASVSLIIFDEEEWKSSEKRIASASFCLNHVLPLAKPDDVYAISIAFDARFRALERLYRDRSVRAELEEIVGTDDDVEWIMIELGAELPLIGDFPHFDKAAFVGAAREKCGSEYRAFPGHRDTADFFWPCLSAERLSQKQKALPERD